MVFNSFNFWLIFPFIFVIYWAIPSKYNKWRNMFLLAVSYLLYMNWNPAFAIVLLGVTAITYSGAKCIEQSKTSSKILICWCFGLLGLLPLLVFKYYNFLNDSLTEGLENIGIHFSLPGLNWAIPVGISFFTFQAVGYLLDVYHKRITAEDNILNYALFVSFFPQVTSGPISTAKDLMPQFKNSHTFNYGQGVEGLKMLLWGMFLKCVVADRLGIYVDTVYSNYTHYSGATCFLASIFYTIQIYGDFAGYSLMAIGIAKTIGFDLINNFNRPYFATSITDFWKRWHISLTRWLTTHVYINLGGNRCSKWRQYWNIMVTFLVSGLWHGANWTFVVWGFIHGLLQIVEKALGVDPKGRFAHRMEALKFLKPIRIIITFMLVNFAWIFFRMPTISDAWNVICKIATTDKGMYQEVQYMPIMVLIFAMLIVGEFSEEYLDGRLNLFSCKYGLVRRGAYLMLFALLLLYGVLDASSFIYVSF